jgi:hypothetical protein
MTADHDDLGAPEPRDSSEIRPVDSALDFLVNAARVSPVLRAKVQIVDDEIRQLRRWKSEATTVLNYWDIAYEMAHIDGRLGDSKPTLMLTEIERLRAEVAFLERLVMNVAVRCVRDPEVAEDMVADEREQMQS